MARRQQHTAAWLAGLAWLGILCLYLDRLGYGFADPDLFGYLSFARLWQHTGVFPVKDVFAYTPTKDVWVYHEWLTGVFYYSIVQLFGFTGLKILKYILGLTTIFLLARTAKLRQAHTASTLIVLFCISPVFSFGFASLRAQAITTVFFALTIFVLEYFLASGKKIVLFSLPLLFVLWGNFHGGFVVGLCVIGLYAVGSGYGHGPWKPLVAALALSALATLINPYGLAYWTYLLAALRMPRPDIVEWHSIFQSLSLGQQTENTLSFLLLLAICVFFFRPRAEKSFTPVLVLAATAAMGCVHLRHQIFFFLAVGAYLPRHLDRFWERLGRSQPEITARWRRLGQRLAPMLAAAMLLYFGNAFLQNAPLTLRPARAGDGDRSILPYQPIEAVEFMRAQGLSGKVLTEFTWGEYLSWELYPSVTVAFDGRYETVYAEGLDRLFFPFMAGRPGSVDFLKRYPPDMVLIEPFLPLHQALSARREWVELYRDAGSVLLGRRDASASRPAPGEAR